MKHELLTLEAREDFLQSQLADSPEQEVLLNPRMADIYRDRVARLQDIEAIEALRSLIDKVVVKLVEGKLTIDLHGQIAAILMISLGRKVDADVGALTELRRRLTRKSRATQ